jgi:hypothetical protein
MKLLKAFFFLALTLFLIVSCSDSENLSTPNVDKARYLELEQSLNLDYTALANGLRNENSNFYNQTSVVAVAANHFGQKSDRHRAFIENFKRVQNNYSGRISSSTTNLNNVRKQKVDEILASISSFDNAPDFKSYLEKQFESIATSNRSIEDKDFLLTYIVSYKATLGFLEVNRDLIEDESSSNGRLEKKSSWWDDWGKCAAGIVGGAGSVGLGGFLGGAAVGTVTLPVVGTVSGAVVGGIGGAIFGGLAGAASAC